jgi:hypothetical protein
MAKARAKQLPLTKAADTMARTQNKMVGNQKSRGKAELMALRESVKAQARSHGTAGPKVQTLLGRIKKLYGDAELQRAIREFNITFKGIQRDPAEGKNPKHYGADPMKMPNG